jgi:DNA primase
LLSLSALHREKLLSRGLSDEAIDRNGYVSTPSVEQANEIAARLSCDDLEGVPGFFKRGSDWQLHTSARGIMIPVRDSLGRISAFQIRRDDAPKGEGRYRWLSSKWLPQGSSPGTPLHFALHHLMPSARQIIVTEGGLKADVIAHLSDAPTIGVAGVSNFGHDFAVNLRAAFPHLREVIVAYDMDLLEKEQVYASLMRLTSQLEAACLQVRIRTWPGGAKGYDDYLLEQFKEREVA